MELDIFSVYPDPDQPRKHFDQGALDELAASISALGVLQPIAVRKTEEGWMIVAGERRWRAAALAGLATIPAHELELEALEVREAALVENIQRERLTPIEEALAFQALVEAHGSVTEVAQRVGKSRSAVSNAIRLLGLPSELHSCLADGSLSRGHAILLLQVDDPQVQVELARRAVRYGMTTRQLGGLINDMGYMQGAVPSGPKPAYAPPPRHTAVVCPECLCEFEIS